MFVEDYSGVILKVANLSDWEDQYANYSYEAKRVIWEFLKNEGLETETPIIFDPTAWRERFTYYPGRGRRAIKGLQSNTRSA